MNRENTTVVDYILNGSIKFVIKLYFFDCINILKWYSMNNHYIYSIENNITLRTIKSILKLF